jgi:hypothetical protein
MKKASLLLLLLFWFWSYCCAGCHSTNSQRVGAMGVYWVNLERSVERKEFMLKHLNFYGLDSSNRVSAMTPSHIYVPDNLNLPADCKTSVNLTTSFKIPVSVIQNQTLYGRSKIVVLSHCGRKKNKKRELAVTLTHLHAIRRAINDENNTSPYALILEDDLNFVFEVDFEALLASAPPKFGILQLITSNDYSVMNLWHVYRRYVYFVYRFSKHEQLVQTFSQFCFNCVYFPFVPVHYAIVAYLFKACESLISYTGIPPALI